MVHRYPAPVSGCLRQRGKRFRPQEFCVVAARGTKPLRHRRRRFRSARQVVVGRSIGAEPGQGIGTGGHFGFEGPEAGHPVHGACSEFVDVNLLADRHGVQVDSLKRWKLGLSVSRLSCQSSFLDGGPVLRRRQHGGTSSALSVKSITPQARKA
jgi:hypothetical protein